jgi:ribosome recycling factor
MDTYLKELEGSLRTVTDRLLEELRGVRSNRPSVGLVEDVKVEAYGQTLTVKEMGSLSVRPPRDIEVSVWDQSVLGAVAKAIESSKSGFSVSVQGNLVRVTLPAMTDERRAELSKLVKRMTEDVRIEIRNRRDDTNKKIRAAQDAGTVTEDQMFRSKDQIQKIVDAANQKAEQALEAKLAEIAE